MLYGLAWYKYKNEHTDSVHCPYRTYIVYIFSLMALRNQLKFRVGVDVIIWGITY